MDNTTITPEMIASASVEATTDVQATNTPIQATNTPKRNKGWFPSGTTGNPKGRPKGVPSVKAAMARVITRKDCEQLCEVFLKKALNGDIKSAQFVVELLGEVGNNVPTIQMNTFTISGELVDKAREYAIQNAIIDVEPVKMIEDNKNIPE